MRVMFVALFQGLAFFNDRCEEIVGCGMELRFPILTS